MNPRRTAPNKGGDKTSCVSLKEHVSVVNFELKTALTIENHLPKVVIILHINLGSFLIAIHFLPLLSLLEIYLQLN